MLKQSPFGNFISMSSFAIFLQLPKRIGKVQIKVASSVLLSKTCESVSMVFFFLSFEFDIQLVETMRYCLRDCLKVLILIY